MSRLGIALCAFLTLVFVSPDTWAAKVGSEFRVNTRTIDNQFNPSVAKLTNGFVVVWTSSGQDGSLGGIYGQRYTAAGVRTGVEFRINTRTLNDQAYPSVAGLTNGGFVVIWHSNGQDGSGQGVYGQRYTAAGVRAGTEFRVNTRTTLNQLLPSVAALSTGGFVVTWTSFGQDGSGDGVYGQRYNTAGAVVGTEFKANTFVTGAQTDSSVAPLTGGGFVVTWMSYGQDLSGGGIYGQRYTAAGARVGLEFRANSRTIGAQTYPSVAGLTDGRFVVTWASYDQDGSMEGIYGQRYTAAGLRAGGEMRINIYSAYNQLAPCVAGLTDGGFVVTWASLFQDISGYGAYARRYSPLGAAVGGEFRVNTYTSNHQGWRSHPGGPSVAPLAGGTYVITWPSYSQEGPNDGVYGQRFN